MMQQSVYVPLTPRAYSIAPIVWFGKILFLIGFATSHWIQFGLGQQGLWYGCDVSGFICGSGSIAALTWFNINAVRGLECLAFILISVASFQSLYYIRRHVKERLVIGAICVLLGGILGIIGCVVFAAKLKDFKSVYLSAALGYSFYLTVAGNVVALAGSPLLFLEYRSLYH